MVIANKKNDASAATGDGNGAQARILVIDTDPGIRWSLEKGLGRSGYRVVTAESLSQVEMLLAQSQIDTIVMELLPEAGLDFRALSTLIDTPGPHKVICVSADASPQTIIECVRLGAADYLMKPFSLADIRRAVAKNIGNGAHGDGAGNGDGRNDASASSLIGVSAAMRELRHLILRAAQSDLNCLVRGESGVGKDVVTREIHRQSGRSDAPFIKINCGALPEHLLESELFGYEKGAFTGAYKAKPGMFSLAHPGIIFLDEIGDMHPSLQSKILQVIEHKEFSKVGGQKPVHVDVQIIAATNANLEQKIGTGQFRDDLFFRLNEVAIWVPPLRERSEDVPLLVNHFIEKRSDFRNAEAAGVLGADLETLSKYAWPGNIRELESTVKRWLAFGRKKQISDYLETSLVRRGATVSPSEPPQESTPTTLTHVSGDEIDPEVIFKVLEENRWNRRKAAAEIGISYSALRRRIEKYGLDKRIRK